MSRRASEVIATVAPALVRLRQGEDVAAGFLVAGSDLVATCVHAIDSAELEAELPDGRRVHVVEVAGLDPRRGLALLRLAAPGGAGVELCRDELPAIGTRALVVGVPGPFGLAPVDTRVTAHREVAPGFVVLELERSLEESCWGGPVLDDRGRVVGVAAAAWSESGTVGLAIPARHLVPLLTCHEHHPVSVLSRRRQRHVPKHPLSLLDGCPEEGLEQLGQALVDAIQLGAPTYNKGDHAGCYRIYASTAKRLCEERVDCPGATVALREALDQAAGLCDPDDQAWAMRDAFDGLLGVLEKWMEARGASQLTPDPKPGKKTFLN